MKQNDAVAAAHSRQLHFKSMLVTSVHNPARYKLCCVLLCFVMVVSPAVASGCMVDNNKMHDSGIVVTSKGFQTFLTQVWMDCVVVQTMLNCIRVDSVRCQMSASVGNLSPSCMDPKTICKVHCLRP